MDDGLSGIYRFWSDRSNWDAIRLADDAGRGRVWSVCEMTSTVDYGDKIPNNVDLGRDRVLQRALEHWQPAYMGWWYDMGPSASQKYDVSLRTAISVDPEGWVPTSGTSRCPTTVGASSSRANHGT